jgi:hypothetical protein
MDGKGRCRDNIFVERLWRSLKYEEVYLKGYQSVSEARAGIGAYFSFYNQERPHQALGYRTPKEIFATKGPSTGGVDASAKTIMAQEEPERRCFCDTDLIPYSWYKPDTRVMATNGVVGDSLNSTPFLSKPLGPPQYIFFLSTISQIPSLVFVLKYFSTNLKYVPSYVLFCFVISISNQLLSCLLKNDIEGALHVSPDNN